MKAHLLMLSIIVSACCSKPAPEKLTNLSLELTLKKDTLFFYNIKRIYAVGAKTSNPRLQEYPKVFETRRFGYSLDLPVSYASDSTIYVFENKKKANDTLIVYYKRNISYGEGDNCGFQQTLSEPPRAHYSTLTNYKLNVVFGTYGQNEGWFNNRTENACTIRLTEKQF